MCLVSQFGTSDAYRWLLWDIDTDGTMYVSIHGFQEIDSAVVLDAGKWYAGIVANVHSTGIGTLTLIVVELETGLVVINEKNTGLMSHATNSENFVIGGRAQAGDPMDGEIAHCFCIESGYLGARDLVEWSHDPVNVFAKWAENNRPIWYLPMVGTSPEINLCGSDGVIQGTLGMTYDIPLEKPAPVLNWTANAKAAKPQTYPLPDSRLEMPELYITGRIPTGPVMLDDGHWMTKNTNCFWWHGNNELHLIEDLGRVGAHVFRSGSSTDLIKSVGHIPIDPNTPISGRAVYMEAEDNDAGAANTTDKNFNFWRGGTKSCSVLALCTVEALTSPYDPRLVSHDEGTNEQDHDWMVGFTNTGVFRVRMSIDGTTYTAASSASEIADGDTVLVVGQYDAKAGQITCDAIILNKGYLVKTTAVNTSPPVDGDVDTTSTRALGIGRPGLIPSNATFNGYFYWGALVNSNLNTAQMLEIAHDPFAMLIPE
jgi:hypothetical protein